MGYGAEAIESIFDPGSSPSSALGGTLQLAGLLAGNPMTMLIGSVVSATDKINKWGESLHKSNMGFAQFSGPMATVKAGQFAREVQISKYMGDNLASSAKELADAKFEFDKTMAPRKVRWQKMLNKVGGALYHVGSEIANFLNKSEGGLLQMGSWLGIESMSGPASQRYAEVQAYEERRKKKDPDVPEGTTGLVGSWMYDTAKNWVKNYGRRKK